MKLQNLTIIFIIIILPIVLVLSAYIGYEIKTINKQNMYNTGLISATHDAIFSFELNTKNDSYNNNAETKRSNIKAAIKTFENSLSTTCNLGLYNNEAIEEYIPAIAFGLYDGFYMYAPSELTKDDGTATYKHNLRNYVYYSEEIKDESKNIDIVIRYSLDNYVAITGNINGIYVTKSGYLTYFKNFNNGAQIQGKDYNGLTITDSKARQYYSESFDFTYWFMEEANLGNIKEYLNISATNDPENESSAFVQHKREIMKQKIEEALNSSITAYANKSRNNYKMPKFSEEDWERVYSNISVISFVQGMNLGFKDYNNYCILNSTNNQEYVNPNLMYFIYQGKYHDIRCAEINNVKSEGYKIGDFEKIKRDVTDAETGETTDEEYYYKHNETACYECINGSLNTNESIYNYVRNSSTAETVKQSYFTALAKERYNTTKLSNKLDELTKTVKQAANGYCGTKKTKDEVESILNEIYNKYTHRDDSKTIFVSFNITGHYNLFKPRYINNVKKLKDNKTYNISIMNDSTVVIIKIEEE